MKRMLLAVLAVILWMGQSQATEPEALFDDNLVVIISDLHINPEGYQPERCERIIHEILAMRPLPRNVLSLGDIAYLCGKVEEYVRARQILEPLEKAGITLTMAMGNHDRRNNFALIFPEHAANTLLPGFYVNVVSTSRADFVLMDSLQENPNPEKWITPGSIDEKQKNWLKEFLKDHTDKPLFVLSHHSYSETGLKELLINTPNCCGYIYGHEHVWKPGWTHHKYKDRNILRTLIVPSTGHWGDIGYVKLNLLEDRAVAELVELEFFFPKPINEGEVKPVQWLTIEEENQGARCTFFYQRTPKPSLPANQ